MRRFKRLSLLAVLVFTISAIGTASASAAVFTHSGAGTLSGKATAQQVWTINGGQMKCLKAETTGVITEPSPLTQQHFTVQYKECTAFGFVTAHVSPATLLFTANGTVHLQNSMTISVTFAGCHLTIGPQSLKSLGYATNGSKLNVTPNVTGITYTTTGGICGSFGGNGTFTGTSEIERVGGGSFTFDP